MQYITYQNTTPIIKSKSSYQLETTKDDPLKVFEVLVSHRLTDSMTTEAPSNSCGLFLLNYHLDRLVESAQALGLWQADCPSLERSWMEAELARRIESFAGSTLVGNTKVLVYIIISAEGLELMLDWFEWPRHPFTPVSIISVSAQRANPRYKTTLMEASIEARKRAHQRHAQEALMVDPLGMAHDCAWSNFFWVDQNGTLCTSDHEQVLPGVTRRIILEQIPTVYRHTTVAELISKAQEMFITQSTMGISPVTSIDGHTIGDECPGTLTMKIGAQYDQWLTSMCVPLSKYSDE